MKISIPFLLCGILILGSCETPKKETEVTDSGKPTLFTLLPSDSTGIDFVNFVENKKDFNIFKYRNFYNGGGVALGDINNDGLVDIFLDNVDEFVAIYNKYPADK